MFLFPAHMTVPGSNAFGNGLLHPLSTPSHLLVLLALGLSIGQHLPLRLAAVGKIFAPVAAAALLLTMSGKTPAVPQPLIIGLALLAAALVILEKNLPAIARAVLLGVSALALGFDSSVEGGTISVTLMTLAGTWLCLTLLVLNIAYYASLAVERKVKWLSIALRVAGSWIAAIALLALAFSLRKA